MYTYYRLTSSKYNGMVVRINAENHHEYYFDKQKKSWNPIGIMIRYFWPESDTFEMYEELTEKQAMGAIG